MENNGQEGTPDRIRISRKPILGCTAYRFLGKVLSIISAF